MHIEEKVYHLHTPKEIGDVDLAANGSTVAVTGAISSNELYVNGVPIPTPRLCSRPKVRALSENRIIFADSTIAFGLPNFWIIDFAGRIISTFPAGDSIADIVPIEGAIAVTHYSLDDPIEEKCEGIVLFSETGEPLLRYPNVDCFCIGALNDFSILALPDFSEEIIHIDARTMRCTYWPAPESVWGASAVTCSNGAAYFFGLDDDNRGIHRWDIGSSQTRRVAEYTGPLRGLRNGRFLAHGTTGYTVISLIDD